MAGRIRSIKPEIFKHGELYDLEEATALPLRVAFMALFALCDREGRFRWKPREMQTDMLPYDRVNLRDVLEALARGGFVRKYEVDGETYGCIPSWYLHQKIRSDEAASKLPPPPPGTMKRPPDTNPLEPETDTSRIHTDQHRGAGAGTGVGTGSGAGVSPAGTGAAPPPQDVPIGEGEGIPPGAYRNLTADRRVRQVVEATARDTVEDWLRQWDAVSLAVTIRHGLDYYAQQKKPPNIIAWVRREEKTLKPVKPPTTIKPPPPDPYKNQPPPTAAELEAAAAEVKKRGLKIAPLVVRISEVS